MSALSLLRGAAKYKAALVQAKTSRFWHALIAGFFFGSTCHDNFGVPFLA
jgi:hypothetical protein